MAITLKILGLAALGLTLVPPLLFLSQTVVEPMMKWLMVLGCLLWFVTAPFFMKGGSD